MPRGPLALVLQVLRSGFRGVLPTRGALLGESEDLRCLRHGEEG